MKHREYNSELVTSQEKLRKCLLTNFYKFDNSNFERIIIALKSLSPEIDKLINATKDTSDERFFQYYRFLIMSFYHLFNWGQKELNASADSSISLSACKSNIELIDLNYFDYIPDFQENITALRLCILTVKVINDIRAVIDKFLEIPFPTIYTFEVAPYSGSRRNLSQEFEKEERTKITVLSIELFISGEPWANPQILKPDLLYTIMGKLSLNQWPDGFEKLILKHVSTSNNNWFNLSLPEVSRVDKNEFDITGHIVFKYPQNSFDESIAIRLLAFFQNSSGDIEYPTIIGYDQLIAKVLDSNSAHFLTGFNNMNKVVFDIEVSLTKELPNLDITEKRDFLLLLSGIINYQGFCLQQGIYKERNKISEDVFRDDLIRHLIGLPYLGKDIIKEGNVAGGRVEISYKGIISELKVENSISDRSELIKKYGKQPVAYASGNGKQLSILCILDLTVKNFPPAPPSNNVQLITPKVHGFEYKELEYPPKLALIVIDGNTKKPSDYSK